MKLRNLLAFAVFSSPFIKQTTACYNRSLISKHRAGV
jgi:hypothetical protein